MNLITPSACPIIAEPGKKVSLRITSDDNDDNEFERVIQCTVKKCKSTPKSLDQGMVYNSFY